MESKLEERIDRKRPLELSDSDRAVGECKGCAQTFGSRNQLFKHLRESSSCARESGVCEQGTGRVKKCRVAVTIGYIGTKFHGNQISPGVPTVEAAIFAHLKVSPQGIKEKVTSCDKSTEGVLEGNGLNSECSIPEAFTRAARTDKGVHAVCNVMGFNVNDIKQNSAQTAIEVKARLDESLKDVGIKIVGVTAVPNTFDARKHCNRRVYEYMIPAWALELIPGKGRRDPSDVKKSLKAALKVFHGTHNFHNYTRKDPESDISVMWRHIARVFCWGEVDIGASSERYYVISISGEGFMYNQMRYMIGMLVAAMREVCTLPDVTRTLAPDFFPTSPLPLAPASHLYLRECWYEKYEMKNRLSPSLRPPSISCEELSNLKNAKGLRSGDAEHPSVTWREVVQKHISQLDCESRLFRAFVDDVVDKWKLCSN